MFKCNRMLTLIVFIIEADKELQHANTSIQQRLIQVWA